MPFKRNISDYGVHTLHSFTLDYGKVVNDIDVEYITSGIPKYDDEGYISNAIVFCPTVKGNRSILKSVYESTKETSFKKDDFFFIIITPFGTPNSFSPSSSGLNDEFPQYNIKDIVNFKRQFLAEKFKIKKLFAIVGEDMGGYEVFTWGCEYSDDMESLIIVNSDFKVSGYRHIISKGFEAIIESNEDYYSDDYSISLSQTIAAIHTLLFAQSLSEKTFNNLSNDEIDVLMDDFVDESLMIDIYDFYMKNSSIRGYDVEDKLEDIRARTLIIYSDVSIYFKQRANVDFLKSSIENSEFILYESERETIYDDEDYSVLAEGIISFLNGF